MDSFKQVTHWMLNEKVRNWKPGDRVLRPFQDGRFQCKGLGYCNWERPPK